jgi:hypothetical protein
MLTIPEAGVLHLFTNAAAPDLNILESEYSPTYARKETSKTCAARGEYALPVSVEWKAQPMS